MKAGAIAQSATGQFDVAAVQGWQAKSFEDCIEPITYSTKVQRKDFLSAGTYPVVSQEDAFINGYWDCEADLFRVERPVVVFGDHTRAFKYIDFDFVLGADGVKVLKPKPFLHPRFFFYQLQTAKLESLGYARHYRLLKEHVVAYPEYAEQSRIVALLDEAFEGIATAKANAEKNLRNVRELFESHLDAALLRTSADYVETTLGAEVELLPGYAFPSGGYTDAPSDVRLLRGDNVMQGYLRWDDAKKWRASDCGAYARFALQEGDLVLAMDRPWVKAGLKRVQIAAEDLPCLLVQRTARLRVKSLLKTNFLNHLVGSQSFSRHLLSVQTGIGVPHISGKQIESFRFMRPSLAVQEAISDDLDELRGATECLAETYERKLAALDELKKSLLHQAFSGALTSSKPAGVAQQPTLQITTPEFTANVIYLTFARHERQGRERNFGHVKEQKTLHLVEAIVKIDLGRLPMRDAAGPNDFQHMLRAEAWAKANHFFEMVPLDGRYEFKKLSAFEEQLLKARQSLAPYLPQLESVIDLLVPMDKEEAEVFVTVHAAWNNLLIDQAAVTDDAIVSAAREDWHADKRAIPAHCFHSAIELIRQKSLFPDGTGKYVGGQQSLKLL